MVRRFVFVAALLALTAGEVGAEDSSYEQAIAAFERGDHARAATLFEAAYRESGEAAVLFAWAQSTRLSGDCRRALPLYRRFLSTGPVHQDAEAARAAMAQCPVAASGGALPPDADSSAPPRLVAPAPASDARDSGTGWLLPALLVTAGAATAVSAVGFWRTAVAESDADDAPDYPTHREASRRADRNRSIGIVAGVVAAGSLVGAASIWLMSDGDDAQRVGVRVEPSRIELVYAF